MVQAVESRYPEVPIIKASLLRVQKIKPAPRPVKPPTAPPEDQF